MLWAAVMRMNEIPARVCQGQLNEFRQEENIFEDITESEFNLGFHAMAEFWSDSVGDWIPCEATDRSLYKKKKKSKTIYLR